LITPLSFSFRDTLSTSMPPYSFPPPHFLIPLFDYFLPYLSFRHSSERLSDFIFTASA